MPTPPPANAFTLTDWIVLVGYLVVVVVIGMAVGRRKPSGDDFFLAGRSMPMGAVAISVLATSLSAATFIGGPQQSYRGDLTYFTANLGGLLAVIVVAVLFVPAFYRRRVTSIYELLGHAYGAPTRTASSFMFMAGRVMASGARLFMVALPFSLIVFGDIEPVSMLFSILVIAAAATAYTVVGGIRAVIWTDVIQAVVFVSAVVVALLVVWSKIPASAGEIIAALRVDPVGGDKLRLIDLSFDPSRRYTIWTAITGLLLFNLAAFGTDQDLCQRLLTCRSARSSAGSIILSNLMAWPVVFLFLVMGVLLYVYYKRPDLMGSNAPLTEIDDSRKVFLQFILDAMPVGMRGLMMAGLFAAAMSSMDSALNAMASTTVVDFYRPWRRRSGGNRGESAAGEEGHGDEREMRVSRLAIIGWAAALAVFAGVCVFWQRASGQTLIDFALGVMVFAYAGLLGVFLTALLTKRGNAASSLAALVVGFASVLLMRDGIWQHWSSWFHIETTLAFPWQMVIATTLSFTICCAGGSRPRL